MAQGSYPGPFSRLKHAQGPARALYVDCGPWSPRVRHARAPVVSVSSLRRRTPMAPLAGARLRIGYH